MTTDAESLQVIHLYYLLTFQSVSRNQFILDSYNSVYESKLHFFHPFSASNLPNSWIMISFSTSLFIFFTFVGVGFSFVNQKTFDFLVAKVTFGQWFLYKLCLEINSVHLAYWLFLFSKVSPVCDSKFANHFIPCGRRHFA